MIRKELINYDTYEIELEFPDKNWISGLWPSAHFKFHFIIDGKQITK
jgi:hypothetical protein